MVQQQLQFDTDKQSIRAAVLDIMRDGKWRTSYQIQDELKARRLFAGESTITAKLRDLRKRQHGAHTVTCEHHEGRFEYRIT